MLSPAVLSPAVLGRARRAALRGATALSLVVAGLLGASGSAHAGVQPCSNYYVCVTVGTPGSNGGTSGGGGGGGGGGGSACRYGGQVMACYIPGIGWLSANDGCYYMRMQPQPPAGDPLWQGHQPGDGAVYVRTCPLNNGGGTVSVWMPAPPPMPPQVSPEELAHLAADAVGRQDPAIGTAPAAGQHGLVNMPIMMWLATWTAGHHDSWVPWDHRLVATASVPGLSVTALVYSPSVTWVMGDGTRNCFDPGRPYPANKTTPCSYTYHKASDDYAVHAEVHWVVRWYSSQNPGVMHEFTLNDLRSPTVDLRIEEIQVLN